MFGLIMTRLGDLGVISGEFCVLKLIASTYIGQIGASDTQIITKPVTSPSTLTYELLITDNPNFAN